MVSHRYNLPHVHLVARQQSHLVNHQEILLVTHLQNQLRSRPDNRRNTLQIAPPLFQQEFLPEDPRDDLRICHLGYHLQSLRQILQIIQVVYRLVNRRDYHLGGLLLNPQEFRVVILQPCLQGSPVVFLQVSL